ncbi:hypothetical protein N9042_00370 [bacterium]|jgi:hypothetical protein|nr:hypothetical protein [bacterium]|tara:strand:- start:323 stop:556 length:234 start_codon:yes stop_codon:yes gene_type:complete
MDNIIEFPRMKKSEELTDKLVTALIAHCHKEGMNTVNPDFVFDMAWVHKFLQATVDNQHNIANDLCRLTRAQGLNEN